MGYSVFVHVETSENDTILVHQVKAGVSTIKILYRYLFPMASPWLLFVNHFNVFLSILTLIPDSWKYDNYEFSDT